MRYKIGDIVKYDGNESTHHDKDVIIKGFDKTRSGVFIYVIKFIDPSPNTIQITIDEGKDISNWRILPTYLKGEPRRRMVIPDELFEI